MEPKKQLKIIIQSVDSIGHMMACIGLAQALKQRGHRVYFINSPSYAGSYEKFDMDEIIVGKNATTSPFGSNESDQTAMKREHPIQNVMFLHNFLTKGIISGKSSFEKLDSFDKNNDSGFHQKLQNHIKETHEEISDLMAKEKPDLIIIDNFLVYPCIAFGKIPWATLISSGPLCLFDSSELPPLMSGERVIMAD
ncbi:hypothetical protein QR98_0091620 [Sarcoptes scabiei]|uniref:Uncharacterized protein n=1 Tax=Sarcoptes scabiei TaxID=52283 RepID=A0A132AI59_SARSC|nr:hypothetical protein QR98_0091620 [Sarcoptes scabiei]